MTDHLRHVVVGGGVPVTSILTGRDLLVNDDAVRFRVPASFTTRGVAAARAAFEDRLAGLSARTRKSYSVGEDRPLVESMLTAECPAELATAVENIAAGLLALVTPRRFGGLRPVPQPRGPLGEGVVSRAVDALILLWRHDCLLAPSGEARFGLFLGQRQIDGRDAELLLGAAARVTANLEYSASSQIARIMLAVGGVKDVGDLSADVLAVAARAWREEDPDLHAAVEARVPGLFAAATKLSNRQVMAILRIVREQQVAAYEGRPEILALIPKTYAAVRPERPLRRKHRESPRKDQTFAWIARKHPNHIAWQRALADHVAAMGGVLDLRAPISSLVRAIGTILGAAAAPLTPAEACRSPKTTAALMAPTLATAKRTQVQHVAAFFRWVITEGALRPDGTVDPHLGNPVDLLPTPKQKQRAAQSTRPKMPRWLMQKAIDLIVGGDYAWPRTRDNDKFDVLIDGAMTRVWSPVLAELTLLRLLLPIRSTQARLLGSGEGDSWLWVPPDEASPDQTEDASWTAPLTAGRWVANTSRWAPPRGEERVHGFLRRIWDDEQGTWSNGLFISTNKTQDKVKGFVDLGYEIPWISAEIQAIYARVLRFQQRYNAARQPKSRAELSREPTIVPKDVAHLLPKMHYLFRDAAHLEEPDEPVTVGRVQDFWNEMMAELEVRVAADPDIPRNQDGSPPTLVLRRDAYGRPTKVRYNAHSARVTGLSRLALGGCPVQVLMMLAGHATWLMTLYYVKMTPGEMRRALNDAEARIEAMDPADLEEALATVDPEVLRRLHVANSAEGTAQFAKGERALMAASDLGLCPNGGTLCHIGGKAVDTASAHGVHGPVPGLSSNCGSCRFLVSGPHFLGGILARINACAVEVLAAGDRLRAAESHRRRLVAERRRAGAEAPATLVRKLHRAQSNVEAAEAHAEDLAERYQKLHRLQSRCLAALHEQMRRDAAQASSNGRNLLVLNGTAADVQVSLQRCTEIALWNRVCFDSELYAVDPTESANRRAMRLDVILGQSGRPAVFAALTDAERVAVGNAFARWLETRLGPAGADEVYEGRRTLAEAGLLDDIDTILPHAPRSMSATALLPTGQRLLASPVT